MNYRQRHRVDWDEEIRKTERIRRKGLFVSAFCFGAAAIFIFGTNRMEGLGEDLMRKIIFALCFAAAMFVLRITWRRRERLRLLRQEEEADAKAELARLAKLTQKAKADKEAER